MIIEKKYCGDKKLLEMVEQAVDHLDSTSIADILTGMGYHNGNTLPVEIHQVSGHKDWGLPYTPSEVASEMKGSAHEAQHRSEKNSRWHGFAGICTERDLHSVLLADV